MNLLTLELHPGREREFWSRYSRLLIATDAVSAIIFSLTVLFGVIDPLGVFGWELVREDRAMFWHCITLMVLRALQLLLISRPSAYWRHRIKVNVAIKFFMCYWLQPAVLRAGSSLPIPLRLKFITDQNGDVIASTAIIRALLIPTGVAGSTMNMFCYQLPFRSTVLLQLLECYQTIRAGCVGGLARCTHPCVRPLRDERELHAVQSASQLSLGPSPSQRRTPGQPASRPGNQPANQAVTIH
jgi:hypothetical protein